jgi:hypothetical protein
MNIFRVLLSTHSHTSTLPEAIPHEGEKVFPLQLDEQFIYTLTHIVRMLLKLSQLLPFPFYLFLPSFSALLYVCVYFSHSLNLI